MKKKKLCINKVREEFDKYIDNRLKEEICGNEYEKKCKILKSENTTKYKILNNNNGNQSGNNLNNLDLSFLNAGYLYHKINISSEPTDSHSKINENSSSYISHDLLQINFNLARIKFCLMHKLYDVPLTTEYENFNHPIKYQINNTYYSYVYSNELITYCITSSGFIFKSSMLNNTKINSEYKGSKFNQVLGLYMCGKEIKLNENLTKKCAPNEFICKDCIKLNREIYNLKDNYLINVYGRIAKKNKGSYHCFGHFLVDDKIEECISSYTCNACSFLNSFCNYYHN